MWLWMSKLPECLDNVCIVVIRRWCAEGWLFRESSPTAEGVYHGFEVVKKRVIAMERMMSHWLKKRKEIISGKCFLFFFFYRMTTFLFFP